MYMIFDFRELIYFMFTIYSNLLPNQRFGVVVTYTFVQKHIYALLNLDFVMVSAKSLCVAAQNLLKMLSPKEGWRHVCPSQVMCQF